MAPTRVACAPPMGRLCGTCIGRAWGVSGRPLSVHGHYAPCANIFTKTTTRAWVLFRASHGPFYGLSMGRPHTSQGLPMDILRTRLGHPTCTPHRRPTDAPPTPDERLTCHAPTSKHSTTLRTPHGHPAPTPRTPHRHATDTLRLPLAPIHAYPTATPWTPLGLLGACVGCQ